MLDFMELLHRLGAVRTEDHFVYASGKHGPAYIDKRAVIVYPKETKILCRGLARRLTGIDSGIDAIVAPAVGAITLGKLVAEHLPEFTNGASFFFIAEKVGTQLVRFEIKTKPELLAGKRVAVVEDILTTGRSALATVNVARELGADVVAVAALVNRVGVTAEQMEVPDLITLVAVDMDMYPPEDCPLCADGIPINTELGHGASFVKDLAVG